jgi:AcrR family transcriptional regulator
MSRTSTAREKLKHALILLLQKKQFSEISTSEICRRAGISRVTFYEWYDDKQALLDDFLADMLESAKHHFNALQSRNNQANDLVIAHFNLLDTVLDLNLEYPDFSRYIQTTENEELYFKYYWHVLTEAEKFTLEYYRNMRLNFSPEEASSFLCTGLWGFIRQSRKEGDPDSVIRRNAKKLLKGILSSNILIRS